MFTSETVQRSPFADLPETPSTHFKLCFFATVQRLVRHVVDSLGSYEAAWEQFPFLKGYYDELVSSSPEGKALDEDWWHNAIANWEESVPGHLPLRALCEAVELDSRSLTLLLSIGLVEEDIRFGFLFEAMQGGQRRPTSGLLDTWWRGDDGAREENSGRAVLWRLLALGLVQVMNPDVPRSEGALQLPSLLWDVLRGDAPGGGEQLTASDGVGAQFIAPDGTQHPAHPAVYELAPWLRYCAPQRLLALNDLIVPAAVRQALHNMPALLASDDTRALVVRGPQRNGRRTTLGTIARALGRGMLEVHGINKQDKRYEECWRLIGPLATLLHAFPVVVLDVAAGEHLELPAIGGYDGPLGFVLGKQGGISGPCVEQALTIVLDMPDGEARRLHWQRGLQNCPGSSLDAISESVRMTGGNIRRVARLAQAHAALAEHEAVELSDVRQASRALHRQELETLATALPAIGNWGHLALRADTMHELYHLENRCRHREHLHSLVGPTLGTQLNVGVRALLSGPSGTGKTLAARLLASVLEMDLYRLDLSSVVNKYIGETEKNLDRVFARAEELDVILLLDEGDALLTKRTNVQNANDRYANLETNYLLQRLETFEGILLVTTNAGDRIDSAFRRRIDVVIEFHPPDIEERWLIWQLHLPVSHAVDEALLREIAGRCVLTGGQIRNAVLHASLLALDSGGTMTSQHLNDAVQREYRKMAAICPLRHNSTATLNGNGR